MTCRRLLILVAGDPVPAVRATRGGFPELIRHTAQGAWKGEWTTLDLRSDAALPDGRNYAGVVVTGSADSLTERVAWMDRGLAYVRDLVRDEVPTLGICFGHQMLGEALGGRVAANPRGREIGTVRMLISDRHPLLAGHQSSCADVYDQGLVPETAVNMTHLDSVVDLPAGAKVFAQTPQEPHAFVQFAARAWGVQFHPEMDGEVIRAYIEHRREAIASEGLDVEQLLDTAMDTPSGNSILSRFIEQLD